MRAVNLLPRDARTRPGLRLGGSALVAVAALLTLLVVAGLGAGWQSAHTRVAAEQKQLDAARAELNRVIAARPQQPGKPAKPSVPILPEPAVTSEIQPRLDAVSKALSSRVAWDGVLKEFSLIVPSDITVSSLALTGSGGNGFTLSGLAFSQDGVARLLSRLQLIPDLGRVALKSSSADPTTGQVSFTIDAAVKTAPATAGTGA